MNNEILNYVIKDISLSDIVFPKNELRSRITFEDLDELARSIKLVGLMNPITARQIGDKYELIAGYRRVKAAEIANLATIPCRVVNSNDDIADLQRLHENMFREAVNPVDEAIFFKKMLIKHDWRIIDLSVQIHKSPSYVSKRIQLLDADPLIVNALQDQQINLSIADELSKIDDPTSRQRLLYYAINSGATVETVRTWRIQYESDKAFLPNTQAESSYEDKSAQQNNNSEMPHADNEPPPTREIKEQIIETRPCYACLSKVSTSALRVLYLCPDCHQIIESSIHPQNQKPTNLTVQEPTISKGDS